MGKSNGTKRDIVAEITNEIAEALEAGVAPWVRPWETSKGAPIASGFPTNGHTGRLYRGVNVLVLLAAAGNRGYHDSRWVTYRQAQEMGGTVRKGEKGTGIVFWSFPVREVENPTTGEIEKKTIPFARAYTVFNVEQCDGLTLADLPVEENPGTAADRIAEDHAMTVIRGTNHACYIPATDVINVPAIEAFDSEAAYASTLLHELVHSTGHAKRLDRTFGHRFGDEAYAAEELVAELGSAFLCARLGVEGRLQHAEYLGHWAKVLRSDKYAIFTASKAAQAAMEFLLGEGTNAGSEEVAEAA